MIAAMRVGCEGLGAIRRPFDGPIDLPGRPRAHRFLGVDEDLRAEAAPDVGGDDAKLVLRREADERRQDEPRDMRVLARRIEGDRVGPRIIVSDGSARLHRVWNQPVVDEIEPRHMRGGGECRVGRRLVAKVPVVNRIVRRRLMDRGLPRLGRARGVDHGRQHGVVDLDHLGRVAGLSISVGDDDGDVVADIPDFALGERRMGPGLHRRAVLRMDHHAADESADLVGCDVVAGEHGDDAGGVSCGVGVDLVNCRMRMWRAQEIGVGLARGD